MSRIYYRGAKAAIICFGKYTNNDIPNTAEPPIMDRAEPLIKDRAEPPIKDRGDYHFFRG